MTNQAFADLFGKAPRSPRDRLTQREMNLARSIQVVIEEIVLRICESVRNMTGERNLCLAGGVALNCVVNGKVQRAGLYDKLWIQPASGDSGGALGVALAISHEVGRVKRSSSTSLDGMSGSYLGPAFDRHQIRQDLEKHNAVFHEMAEDELLRTVVQALVEEKVVGWFQGRMEFGPRALGNRSILADPRSERMQSILNLKIKYRESFRPFAPAVLCDDAATYFELEEPSPYMLLVADVRKERRRQLTEDEEKRFGIDKLKSTRSDVPAVTHVDYSARIQTVHSETNSRFYRLLQEFKKKTGYGMLVNTSFNIRDEPIVCTPEDAYRCFMGTEMDALVLDTMILWKDEQW